MNKVNIKKWDQFLNESINTKKLIVTYKRVTYIGDRRDFFRAFTEKLSKRGIPFKQNSTSITFILKNIFTGFEGYFNLLKDNDNTYDNYVVIVEYNSENTHKEVIEEFESSFDKIVYSLDTEYEDGFEPFNPSSEYWLDKII